MSESDDPTILSTSLSQVLVAFAVEFDNQLELRIRKTWARPFPTSVVMWANVMRYVGPGGTTVDSLARRSRLAMTALASLIGALERWGYLGVNEGGRAGEKGYGTARGVKPDSVVFPTMTGELIQGLCAPLTSEIERRWEERLGADSIGRLRDALAAVHDRIGAPMPRFLPVVSGNGLFVAPTVDLRATDEEEDSDLPTLLSRVLLGFALDYERESPVSLPIAANVLRVLRGEPIPVGELPAAAGVSKEAVAVSLTWLENAELASSGTPAGGGAKHVALTSAGGDAQRGHHDRVASIEQDWRARYGAPVVDALRSSLQSVLGSDPFCEALVTPAGGWRAKGRHAKLNAAFVARPRDALPHHPMILHRGGWPDGS